MGNLVSIGKMAELENGSMKEVVAEGREILLARVEGKYYATDNRCTHVGGKLSQGKLAGTVVTCPRHGSQFNLNDGQVVRWLNLPGPLSAIGRMIKPPQPIGTYAVKVEDDTIFIEIQPPA